MNGGIFISGIYYSSNKDGAEISRWSGKRKIDGKVSKDKQIYLDKVIDRDRPLGAQDTKPRKRRKKLSGNTSIKFKQGRKQIRTDTLLR
jgi:hypothetical protein